MKAFAGPLAALGLWLFPLCDPALATPAYGLFWVDGGSVALAQGTVLGVAAQQNFVAPTILPITSVFLPAISLHETAQGAVVSEDGTTVIVNQDGTALVNASIANGALHAFARATAPASFVCNAEGDCDGTKSASANVREQWFDTAMVQGPTGIPVLLTVTYRPFGSLSSDVPGGLAAQNIGMDASLTVQNTTRGTSPIDLANTLLGNGVLNQLQVAQMLVFGGDTLFIENQMDTALLVGTETGASFATTSFADTVSFNLDVLTPGFRLTTASGLDYSTLSPTPEPGTLLLVATSLVGALAMRHRRRRPSS